jgi:hypothetical protein
MSNCLQIDCNPDVPIPTPTPLPPCEEGEACKEVVDAACVVYTNEPLPFVNVDTNDRLNDIIRKWAQGVEGGTQAVSTENTLSATIEGNGSSLNPLNVDVQVSTNPDNILKVVDYTAGSTHYTGLEVILTDEIIAKLFTQIVGNLELNLQFCELVKPCLANACNLATNLNVTPQ